jgi:hypothetical protein
MANSPAGEDDTPEALKTDIITLVQLVFRQASEITRLKRVIQEDTDRQSRGTHSPKFRRIERYAQLVSGRRWLLSH